MKQVIFAFSVLFCVTVAAAQIQKSPLIEKARQHRLELVKKQDELLELLLQIPFEQRQYIFPLLSAKKSVPKKIKTHPQVLVWKGKKPTRIADRFKNDAELIQYLPEEFYYFLSPDMWGPQLTPTALEANPNQILQNLAQNTEEMSVMPEELMDIYDGLKVLQNFVNQQQKHLPSPLFFKEWIGAVPEKIQQEILEKTGLKSADFASHIDKIAQAFRLYKNQKIPSTSPEQRLVHQYWSLIPFIFQKTGFQNALDNQIYSD